MTFFQCFQKWNNQFVDTDGAYGPQCMDWMHQYLSDVYGLPLSTLSAPSAKLVFQNFPNIQGSENFFQIKNRPWNTPQQGDIVFFGNGQYGHVCIFNAGNVWSFTSLDQNWPANSPVHVQSHTYLGCLGWLRRK